MKLIQRYEHGKPVFIEMRWSDHYPTCEKCRDVDLSQSATLSKACAQGAPLLNEELVRRQAPEVKRQAKEVREWAKHAGVFKGA